MTEENNNIVRQKPDYQLPDLVRYFLKLGTLGFGGPVALIVKRICNTSTPSA